MWYINNVPKRYTKKGVDSMSKTEMRELAKDKLMGAIAVAYYTM